MSVGDLSAPSYHELKSSLTILIHGKLDFKPENSPKYNYSVRQIEKLTELFPDTKIIISTWENEFIPLRFKSGNINIIFGKDPGASLISKDGETHNLDRHVQSTKSGLSEVDTEYVLIIRPDILIKNDKILKKYVRYWSKYFGQDKTFNSEFSLEAPLLALADGTKNEDNANKYFWGWGMFLFHTCDFLYLGKTSDMRKIFNISISQDGRGSPPQFALNFYLKQINAFHTHSKYIQRWVAEAYPIVTYLKHKSDFKLPNTSWEWDKETINLSQRWHSKAVILLNMRGNGIVWLKNKYSLQSFPFGSLCRYSEFLWLKRAEVRTIAKVYYFSRHLLFSFNRASINLVDSVFRIRFRR
jgi:hypothetical protein